MGNNSIFKMQNSEKIQEVFNPETYKNKLHELLINNANDIVDEAKKNVPYDTGKLYNSFKIIEDDENVRIINTAEYAGIVENGTRERPAVKYLQNAVESNKDELIVKINKLISEDIVKKHR